MTQWHIAMSPVRQPCGCSTWQQFIGGRWVAQSWRCHQHKVAS